MDIARLQEVPLFADLKRRDLKMVAQLADEIDVPAGKVLAREGEIGHEFFVLESGWAEVTRHGEALRELGPGDFFGEMALLEEDRRTATVTATEPVTAIVLTGPAFRSLLADHPELNRSVRAQIERIRRRSGDTATS